MTDPIVTLDEIEAARERVREVAHHTPLDVSNTLADLTGAAEVRLKLENLQRTGAFKVRGAYNAISGLSAEEREAGVVTVSSGNHAQGVAFAARALGVDATVVMPSFAPAAKIEATRGYGATVDRYGSTYGELRERAAEYEAEGMTLVHPFDDPAVIAGQGTVGLEIAEAFPEIDVAVVPVGGGGLISGIATALRANDPDVRVVGVETEGSAHARRALERGEIYERPDVDTIAEGLASGQLEPNTFAIIEERVDEVVEVSEGDATAAMALLAERAKVIVEAAAATPTAALLSGAVDVGGENVAAVVSGGNIGLTEFGEFARAGLGHLGRYRRLKLAVRGWPAPLGAIADAVEDAGAELDDLRREPLTHEMPPNRRPVTVGVAGTGPEHIEEVVAAIGACEGVTVLDGRSPSP